MSSTPAENDAKPKFAPAVTDSRRVIVGYLTAVTMATLAFAFHSAWQDIEVNRALVFHRMSENIFFWLFFSGIFWVYAFFTTAWPFAGTLTFARRYGIRNFAYYTACGAIAGVLLTLIVVVPPWVHNMEHDNTFIEEWVRAGRAFAAYGACGGLAFWYKAGRHFRLPRQT